MSGAPVHIRPREVTDLPHLVAALRLVAAVDGYPSRWPRDTASWLHARDVLGAWVPDRAGRPLGQVVVRRPRGDVPVALWCARTGAGPERAVVTRLFVTPRPAVPASAGR